MHSTTEILRNLVAIPSVSALSNATLLNAIEEYLVPHGWYTQRLPYRSADGIEKANMLAIPNRFREYLPNVDLLFVCHTDTVPFQSTWAEATCLSQANGFLHGCGSCDVKGSLAGLLSAALQTDPEIMTAAVAFAFTAEEEIGCIGATRLVGSGAIRARQVIVCEPTSLRPATAGKGYGLAEVRVVGHEAHSAFPEMGVSAINMAAEMIVQLEHWQKTAPRVSDRRFHPPSTTFNVGVLHGGTAKNLVAGECQFLVEWRPVPGDPPGLGGEILQQLATELESKHPECSIEVRVVRADAGFSNCSSSHFGSALSKMLGRPETGISFGSEATRFASVAQEVVVLGPGDMLTAHSERECIPLDELDEWTKLVRQLLVSGSVPKGTEASMEGNVLSVPVKPF